MPRTAETLRPREQRESIEPGSMTIADILNNDHWSLAEGEDNGKPLYIRFRDEFRTRPDLGAFPRLIRIVWSYPADENGLPVAEAISEIKDFETRLIETVQPDQIAVLVAASTNNGKREWMFYASQVAAFQKCLNEVQQGYEHFPIDVTYQRDPNWTVFYEEILATLG